MFPRTSSPDFPAAPDTMTPRDDPSPGFANTATPQNGASNPEPAPKRRRVALACSACRIRKSRCNGGRPRCDACERLGFECLYEQQEASANLLVPKDLFAALETRVKLLETKLELQNGRLTAVESDARRRTGGARQGSLDLRPGRLSTEDGHGQRRTDEAHQDSLECRSSDVIVNIEGCHDSSIEQSMTDGMAVSFVDEQDCGFFGPSSNIAFMRHILRAIKKRQSAHRRLSSQAAASEFSTYEGGIVNTFNTFTSKSPGAALSYSHKINANILPPDQEMQRLIRAYFSNTGLLFPYIHEEAFLDTYERFRASGFRTNVRRTWLGLLNMIFAMATCTSCWEESGSDYRFEQSDVYYRRARELCQIQMFRGTTLEIGKTGPIGLMFSVSSRSLSMTFGRPCAIPEEYIRLDLPKPLPPCASVPEETQSLSTGFFNASIQLYRIMGRIITTLYGSNLGCDEQLSETVTVTSIIQFGQELTDWQNNLPPNLALHVSADLPREGEIQDPTTERVRLILSLRYLNVQLLLHRPTFVRSLGALLRDPMISARNPAPVNHMQSNFDRTFVQVAENIIEIIHIVLTRPDLGRHLIGAWWFTLYYAFSAALAIFGSLVISQDQYVDDGHNTDRLERAKRSLTQASDALLRMGTENMIISRCVDFLQQLLRAVNAWDSMSPQTLSSFGQSTAPEAIARSESGNFDLESELFSTMPAFDTSAVGLGDDIELGHFFAADFQRWFERNHW
ncbi:hypothetical protein BHE90_012026 [Fusarium euwallaceae]|uniref:Zn(2)-C6 fungal-type domain-containing protein n=1 Tax=Fusarium euwallaceae TaxID=1147111 RepID=A0A430LCW4_9HYPO|nr:hypothetical protein BHE90_012026 [Fusarium euwallaceae]